MSSQFQPEKAGELQYATGSQSPAPAMPQGNRWVTWLVVLGAIAIVAGPVVLIILPREISQWYVAAGMENSLDGDTDGALAHFAQALAWDDDNSRALVERAALKWKQRDLEGSLADLKQALEIAPDDQRALRQRCQVLLESGNFSAAIDDASTLENQSRRLGVAANAEALNNLAYFRAIGNLQLDEALKDVQAAIRKLGNEPSFLDTRGFIHFRQGDYQAARKDLDPAVAGIEQQYRQLFTEGKAYRQQVVDIRELDEARKLFARNVAVVRYHRALILEKLGESELAEQDYQRVRELGSEPNESLY